MKKDEFINILADKSEMSKKDADTMLTAFVDSIIDCLKKGNEIPVPGLGTFSITHRKARPGRNPRTGAPMQIAASKAPKFKPAKMLKDAVK